MASQCAGSSAALTQTPRARPSRATSALTAPSSVAAKASAAPARSPSAYGRATWVMRPPDASVASPGDSAGLTTVTTAPAASRPSTVRSATAPPPSHGLSRAERAADAEVVGAHERAVDLQLLALDADVGDPVLAARVGAAGDVQLHVLLKARQPPLEILDEPLREALGLRQRELAELGARAGDGAAAERRAAGRQPGLGQLARERGDALAAHVDDDDVLHGGRAQLAIAVTVGGVGEHAQLRRREAPAQHGGARVAEVRLPLRVNTDVVAVDVLGRRLSRRSVERIPQPRLDRPEESLRGPAVLEEEELEARLLAVLAQHLGVAEHLRHRAHDRHRLVPAHEGVEPRAEARIGRESAAHAQREARLTRGGVAQRRETDVVDLGIRAPRAAARDRHLVLAWQVVELRVAVEQVRRLEHQRRGVEHLVGIHAGQRAPRDVARDVAAGAEAREPRAPERVHQRRQVLDGHPVELHVLAHGEVGDAARVALGEVGQRAQLRSVHDAVRDPHADHEVLRRAALAADAADGADAIALRVDAPPAEVRGPLGRDRRVPLAREALDGRVRLPRIQLALEPLRALRLALLHVAHARLRRNRSRGTGRSGAHSTYFTGTSTHDLQRAHFATTRPVADSTRRIALRMITSSAPRATTFARHTGHRPSWVVVATMPKLYIPDRNCQEWAREIGRAHV